MWRIAIFVHVWSSFLATAIFFASDTQTVSEMENIMGHIIYIQAEECLLPLNLTLLNLPLRDKKKIYILMTKGNESVVMISEHQYIWIHPKQAQ